MTAYVIVWEFEVPAMRVAEFEQAYGSGGPWAALFARADGYLGTELLCCAERPGRYLTIDRWESETAFEMFKRLFGAEYVALDKSLEGIASTETRIGAFNLP
ncbi:antibiotic biosynthesis monooxygenase family protein [Sphingomonas cavernae]|uniref:ABM domain-containing protein n=1 Tax=Sphingomonas cavernae TaxID=2320861 RepID=A0A418WLH4_9SPHN|nr:antibiotic biosynthesis monooxygenase family protein [Sphingomonas cavernae]RJF90850.1 hypothetical protein D3876_11740 [Sphingomonas cavernae]